MGTCLSGASNWCFSIKCPPHYSTRLTLLFLRVRHTMGMNHDFNRAWGCEVLILPLESPRWGTKGVVVPGWGTRAGACRVWCISLPGTLLSGPWGFFSG